MNGNDLIILINEGLEDEGSIKINYFLTRKNIELFEFNNGKVYTGLEFLQIANDFVYQGSIEDDSIYGQETNDVINGNLGNDSLYGEEGNDSLYGDEGSDTLYGEDGNDSIYGQEDDDRLYGQNGDDLLYGGEGNDQLYGDQGDDILNGGSGNDMLGGGYGKDQIHGGSGKDRLIGGAGKDQLYGGDGDDIVGNYSHDSGSDSSYDENLFDNGDIIVGGKGDDKIYDTKHSDTIIYNLGDGNDTIDLSEEKENLSGDGRSLRQDKLVFGEGISLENLTFKMNGNDLIILINEGLEDEGSIKINYFLTRKNIELFEFNNGKVYTGLEFLQIANDFVYQGSIEDDSIYGQETNDVINGNLGNDSLYGDEGNDTLNGEDGNDSLYGQEDDDRLYGQNGDDSLYGGEGSDSLYGNQGDDILHGGSGNDRLEGGYGKDQIHGGSGKDRLIGGAGKDQLYGGDGDDIVGNYSHDSGSDSSYDENLFDNGDIIVGGKGDDKIYDTKHSDTIIYNLGDGNDTIDLSEEKENLSGDGRSLRQDKLVFGEGINKNDLSFEKIGGNLLITLTLGGSLEFENWFGANDSSRKIEIFEFSNNEKITWKEINSLFEIESNIGNENNVSDSLTITGTINNDSLYGGDGNDNLHGDSGNDTLKGSLGDDILHGDSGNDRLEGGHGKDQLYGGDGDDNIGNYSHDSGSYSRNDENLFDNGDIIVGGKGDDKIYDTKHSDTIIYNLGDGNDTIDLSEEKENLSGDGRSLRQDKLVFGEGISLENLTFKMNGNDLIILINEGLEDEGSIKINYFLTRKNIELFEFNNGKVYTGLEFLQIANDFVYQGSIEDDSIYGQETNDVINGNLGNDSLYGDEGNDTLNGEDGNDSLYGQEDDDRLYGQNGDDSLYGGEGSDSLYGNQGDDILHGGSGNDRLEGGYGKDQIHGGSGKDRLIGGAGKDQLYGGDGDDIVGNYSHDSGSDSSYDENLFDNGDIIVGGKGDDKIYDTKHSDTIIYNLGDGNDTIDLSEEKENLSGDGRSLRQDKLVFGEGISLENLTFKMNGNDLTIFINEGLEDEGSIKINYFLARKNIELFEFNNGNIYTAEDILTIISSSEVSGTSEGDIISGSDISDDVILGKEGDDNLYGNNGSDKLFGGLGEDNLYGGEGNDSLFGGENDDRLSGDQGDDYLDGGEGNDIITGGYGKDTLKGGQGNDTLGNSSFDYKGSSNETYLYYDNGNTYEGGQGNDIIHDTFHSDTIIYNLGDGSDKYILSEKIENVSGDKKSKSHDKFIFGKDINRTDISFAMIGLNLIININIPENEATLTFENWFENLNDSSHKIEEFVFENGEVISWEEINDLGMYSEIEGTENEDSLSGNQEVKNRIFGLSSDDILNGSNLRDELYGGEGNDVLDGGFGSDLLDGGKGNDILGNKDEESQEYRGNAGVDYKDTESGNTYIGGEGDDIIYETYHADTIIYNLGDGNDVIHTTYVSAFESGLIPRRQDNLVFGEGINKEDLKFTKLDDNSLLVTIKEGDDLEGSITIKNWFVNFNTTNSSYKIEKFTLFNGEELTWKEITEQIMEESSRETNDEIISESTTDTIVYNIGDGDNIIKVLLPENIEDNSTKILFGELITKNDLSFEEIDNNLVIRVFVGTENEGSITIKDWSINENSRIENFEFSDGTSLTISDFTIGSEEIDISDNQVDSLTQEMSTFGIDPEDTISDLIPKLDYISFVTE